MFSKLELRLLALFTLTALVSGSLALAKRRPQPFIEGAVGIPQSHFPLATRTESERTLAALLFRAPLVKTAQGLAPDLCEVEIADGGKRFLVKLREGNLWHDGTPITLADLRFSLDLIRHPDLDHPLSQSLQGVEIKEGEGHLEFRLTQALQSFAEVLTFPLVPKHLLEAIPPSRLAATAFPEKIIGSGPFRLVEIVKENDSRRYRLEQGGRRLDLIFFAEEADLSRALRRRTLHAAAPRPRQTEYPGYRASSIMLSELLVLLANVRRERMKDHSFRRDLVQSIDRQKVVAQARDGLSPVGSLLGGGEPAPPNLQAETRLRERQGGKPPLRLLTPAQPLLENVATIITNELSEVGIETDLVILPDRNFEKALSAREFDLVLARLSADGADPYPYWHSRFEASFNISGIASSKIDRLLEEARVISDEAARRGHYERLGELLEAEAPGIALGRTHSRWLVRQDVSGIPQELALPSLQARFQTFQDWRIK